MRFLTNYITKVLRNNFYNRRLYSINKSGNLKPPWKILFFGTDEFSLASLKCLCSEYERRNLITKLEVVTNNKNNPVRNYAINKHLHVHNWPLTNTLHDFHIGLVVSFGHLIPKNIINMFPMGMLNVHASLLPRWRGAAPIIYAIANGDKQTGVTIMKIRPGKFDCGEILYQVAQDIPSDMNMPELYQTLANLGAETLITSLKKLPDLLDLCQDQPLEGVTLAPRVNAKMAQINWNQMTALEVYNLSRALTGMFPVSTSWNGILLKLYNVKEHNRIDSDTKFNENTPGQVLYDKVSKLLLVQCSDGKWISCDKVGVTGKKIMTACDFNNGYIKKSTIENRLFN